MPDWSAQVKVTVTLVLFHPPLSGMGAKVAVIVGGSWSTTRNVTSPLHSEYPDRFQAISCQLTDPKGNVASGRTTHGVDVPGAQPAASGVYQRSVNVEPTHTRRR